jgi:hypothetical protein
LHGVATGPQCVTTSSLPMKNIPDQQPLDVDALRSKYCKEGCRRLRPDGIDDYINTSGSMASTRIKWLS